MVCFNTIDRKNSGFSLAEMLVVLAILSIVTLAMPPLAKKTFQVKTAPKNHGRFECYISPTDSDKYIQYEYQEGSGANVKKVNADVGCQFNPPTNVTYITIHAVGGGGAGNSVPPNSNPMEVSAIRNSISYVSNSAVGLWPDWFKYIKQHKPNELNLEHSDSYELLKTYSEDTLFYGLGGTAGTKVSMFFPHMDKETTIIMFPGHGGISGGTVDKIDGEATLVQFLLEGDTEPRNLLVANGGLSGDTVQSAQFGAFESPAYSAEVAGGEATDYGVGSFEAVRFHKSYFEDIIEDTKRPSLITAPDSGTNINKTSGCPAVKKLKLFTEENIWCWDESSINAGWGGYGGYYYLKNDGLDGTFSYQINNYTQSTNSAGEGVKTNFWAVVTKYIPLIFYSRDGANRYCPNFNDASVDVIGQCSLDKSDVNQRRWYCKLPNYDNNGKVNETTPEIDKVSGYKIECDSQAKDCKHIPSQYVSSGVHACKFISGRNHIKCRTSSTIDKSQHACAPRGESYQQFKCPAAEINSSYQDDNIDDNYGICKPTNGGNGAVVIIW